MSHTFLLRGKMALSPVFMLFLDWINGGVHLVQDMGIPVVCTNLLILMSIPSVPIHLFITTTLALVLRCVFVLGFITLAVLVQSASL